MRAVFDGHLGGEHRATGRRASSGGGEGISEGEALAGEAIDVGRANVFAAVGTTIARGKIVRDEENDVRSGGERAGRDEREENGQR